MSQFSEYFGYVLQVYSWGDNTFGQLAHIRSIMESPKKVKVCACIHYSRRFGRKTNVRDANESTTTKMFSPE